MRSKRDNSRVANRKVLLVSYAFPPRHSVGSLRSAKIAKYLPEFGWEPVVLTRDWSSELVNSIEQPNASVITTEYRDRLSIFRRGKGMRGMHSPNAPGGKSLSGINSRSSLGSYLVKEALAFPDGQIGWKTAALRAARRVLQQQSVSMLFSTSPPSTSHLIASELQRETGLPWVADFRDLWTQNHYLKHVFPRTVLERRLERRTMKNATHLTTVSSPLAERLAALHDTPTTVIMNGYDHADYLDETPQIRSCFCLTYTGQLYAGRRDPSLVFAAVRELVEKRAIDPGTFRIRFYGPEGDRKLVYALAIEHGIEELVTHYGSVDYHEAVSRQKESSALLLLNWDTPAEKGVYTAKLFEYLGARRPILAIPRLHGVVDALLDEANAGVVAGTRSEVVHVLKGWYDEFMDRNMVSYNGIDTVIRRYTREAQTGRLAELFDRLAESGVET